MEDFVPFSANALTRKARGAIWHDALACVERMEVHRFERCERQVLARAAFGRVERDNVISHFERGDALADFAHDAGAFMAKDGRKFSLGIKARERVGIVWHTPVAMISTSTSPGLGPAMSIVSMVSGLLASQATAARDFTIDLQSMICRLRLPLPKLPDKPKQSRKAPTPALISSAKFHEQRQPAFR